MKKWLLPAIILVGLGASGCAREEPRLDPIYATIEIQIPCTDSLHIQPAQEPAEGPFLVADPQCGSLAEEFDASGSEIVLHGSSFNPNTETTLIWEDSFSGEFRHRQAGDYLKPITDQEGKFSISLMMPYRLLPPSVDEDYLVWKLTAFQGELVEEEIPIQWDALFEHLYISVIGAIMGIGAGVLVGYYIAKALHYLIQSKPSLRSVGLFVPSRTLLVSLLMHLIYPVLLIVQFGFGAKAGVIWTSSATFLLASYFFSTILLWKWQSVSLASQLRSAVRTMAILSVFFTAWLGYFGMGGIGPLINIHIRLFEYDVALQYYLLLVLIMLVFDLLGGAVEFLLNRREERSQAVSELRG